MNRSSYAIIIDPDNDTVQLSEQNSFSSSVYEYLSLINAKQRIADGTLYKTQSQMGPVSWLISFSTQLIITTPDGQRITAYDVNDEYITETVTTTVIILAFVCFTVIYLIRYIRRTIRQNRASSELTIPNQKSE